MMVRTRGSPAERLRLSDWGMMVKPALLKAETGVESTLPDGGRPVPLEGVTKAEGEEGAAEELEEKEGDHHVADGSEDAADLGDAEGLAEG